ncbi:hypothetical protein KJ885_01880 [Patescibacteria group bacterium]|nr:hypothetical protein [Patescibacteria group bacterium]
MKKLATPKKKPKKKRVRQPKKIRVLEVDQVHGAVMMQNMKNGQVFHIDSFSLDNVNGTDTDAIKSICGGDARILEIDKADKSCRWGCARFRIKWTGRLDNKYWTTNWDTSG